GPIDGEGVVEVEIASAEVTVLQASIDVRAERIAKASNAVECPGAILVAGHRGPVPARATADIAANPAAELAVQQRVRHQAGDPDVVADADVRCRSSRVGSSVDVGNKRRADAEAL